MRWGADFLSERLREALSKLVKLYRKLSEVRSLSDEQEALPLTGEARRLVTIERSESSIATARSASVSARSKGSAR